VRGPLENGDTVVTTRLSDLSPGMAVEVR